MKIFFHKYQGTGNDFIIIDNRDEQFDSKNEQFVSLLCDRRFGIGADGLMLLENHKNYDFTMRYYNSNGKEASMCGNGGRCISAFVVHQNIVENPENFCFMAVDGLHIAKFHDGIVSLKMTDVDEIQKTPEYTFLDTGSPHYIQFVKDCDSVDVVSTGSKIRYSEHFKPSGTNVNFVQLISKDSIRVRTYERGVENETLSCGTGVVASAIATAHKQGIGEKFKIQVQGGELEVKFKMNKQQHTSDIWLIGPAEFVFSGHIEI